MKTSWGIAYSAYAKALLLMLGMSCYWVWFISGLFSTSVWYGIERTSWPWVLVTNMATLVFLALMARRLSPYVERIPVVVAAGLITSAGIVLATLGFNIDGLPWTIVLIGALLTGVGSAPLILFWREASEVLASKRTERLLVALSVICATFFYLFFITLPFVVALVICSIAPIASALLLRASYFSQPHEVPKARQRGVNSSDSSTGVPVLLFLCCGVLAITQGIFKTAYPSGGEGTVWPLAVSSALLVTVIVVAIDFALAKRLPGRVLTKAFMPAAIIVLAFISCAGGYASLSGAAMFSSYFLFLIYTFSELDSVVSSRLDGVQVLALGLCAIDAGFLLGMALGSIFPQGSPTLVLGVILAAAGLGAVAIRLRWSRETERFLQDEDDTLLFGAGFDGEAASPEDVIEGIARQSALVARAYALSDREEEILTHLACGKTAKTIASDTFISYNTVKTHISHIYQKTGVHTREELVLLVVQEGEREKEPTQER